MRWLVVSVAVHAVVAWLLVGRERVAPRLPATARVERPVQPRATEPIVVEMLAASGGGGGACADGDGGGSLARRRGRPANAWAGVAIREEARTGAGGQVHGDRHETGAGTGDGSTGAGTSGGIGVGNGGGIGFGNGGGVRIARDVPAPPPPVAPPPSRARPATLIWPTRNLDVEDESYLFVARVTVDEDRSVVGARMVKTHPGSRGDHAANAIWTFRYLPALDDSGSPIRSTFEQPFQVR